MNPDEVKRERDAIEKDFDALESRLETLRRRPVLEGDAVAAAWRDDVSVAEADAAALKRRSEALTARRAADPSWLSQRHWAWGLVLGLVMPIVTAVLWVYAYNGAGVQLKYFEASTQVIPVLVLALALEGRIFDWASVAPPVLKMASVMNLLWLAVGEGAALYVLADGYSTDVAFALTTLALMTAAVMLLVIAVGGRESLKG